MTDRITALEEQLKQARERLRVATIERAAALTGAVAPTQISTLLDGFVKLDADGNLFVINAEGQRRYSKDGAPFSVHSAVAEFLEKNPHMKKTGRGERHD